LQAVPQSVSGDGTSRTSSLARSSDAQWAEWSLGCAGSRNRRRAHGPSRAPSGAASALPWASSGRACRIA